MSTVPESGRSSPAIRLRSVDFPAPDSPMIATYSPAATCSVTSCRTRRSASPWNPFDRLRTSTDILFRQLQRLQVATEANVRAVEPAAQPVIPRVAHAYDISVGVRLDLEVRVPRPREVVPRGRCPARGRDDRTIGV